MDFFWDFLIFSALDTTSLIGLPTWCFIYLSKTFRATNAVSFANYSERALIGKYFFWNLYASMCNN